MVSGILFAVIRNSLFLELGITVAFRISRNEEVPLLVSSIAARRCRFVIAGRRGEFVTGLVQPHRTGKNTKKINSHMVRIFILKFYQPSAMLVKECSTSEWKEVINLEEERSVYGGNVWFVVLRLEFGELDFFYYFVVFC